MTKPPAPFQCRYSPQLPELLSQISISLAISTYQAGKVIFISATEADKIVQLPRSFKKAMGIALDASRMAIATMDEVLYLKNDTISAQHYPNSPGKYDALYLPRANYYTGQVDVHDLHFGNEKLYAVNTSFSCLCEVDAEYSFKPLWKPFFIDALKSEDRCHLNGLALNEEGNPAFATALGTGNEMLSWKKNLETGGAVIDIEDNEIIAGGLAMPHSPRLLDGKLYLLQSASGKLMSIDPKTREQKTIKEFNAFVRGMSIYNGYAFIGISRLRKNSSIFSHLEMASRENMAGIKVLHLETGAIVAELIYENSVEEIYDVQVVPWKRPGILNNISEQHKSALVVPGKSYWAHPKN